MKRSINKHEASLRQSRRWSNYPVLVIHSGAQNPSAQTSMKTAHPEKQRAPSNLSEFKRDRMYPGCRTRPHELNSIFGASQLLTLVPSSQDCTSHLGPLLQLSSVHAVNRKRCLCLVYNVSTDHNQQFLFHRPIKNTQAKHETIKGQQERKLLRHNNPTSRFKWNCKYCFVGSGNEEAHELYAIKKPAGL